MQFFGRFYCPGAHGWVVVGIFLQNFSSVCPEYQNLRLSKLREGYTFCIAPRWARLEFRQMPLVAALHKMKSAAVCCLLRGGGAGRISHMESFMPSNISRLRDAAFKKQKGLCYYCKCKMSLAVRPTEFKHSNLVPPITECTAEHLQARRDGGADIPRNVVAACRYCNQSRHAKYGGKRPKNFRLEVCQAVEKGSWPSRPQRVTAGLSMGIGKVE